MAGRPHRVIRRADDVRVPAVELAGGLSRTWRPGRPWRPEGSRRPRRPWASLAGRAARRGMTRTARLGPGPATASPGWRAVKGVDGFPGRHGTAWAYGSAGRHAVTRRQAVTRGQALTRRRGLAWPRRFARSARTARRGRATRGGGFARRRAAARRHRLTRRHGLSRHGLTRRHRLTRRHWRTGARRLMGSHAVTGWYGRHLAVALSGKDAAGTRGVHPRRTDRSWWLSSGTGHRRPVTAPPGARCTRWPRRQGRLTGARGSVRPRHPRGCRASLASPGSRASPGSCASRRRVARASGFPRHIEQAARRIHTRRIQ